MSGTPFSGHVQMFARTERAPLRWRLLSGNNREAGRGIDTYADIELCRLAIKDLQVSVAELVPSIRRAAPNQWSWQLARHGLVVVMSSRGFDRLIRCEQALAQFQEAIPDAEINTNVMVSGARRW